MKHLLTILTLLAAATSALAKAPNILFILADDQSWSGTSVRMMADEPLSGSKVFKTPNLEKLAAKGMTFSQAYAAHCKCECSRAAIQMGRTTTTLYAPDKTARNLERAGDGFAREHAQKGRWQLPRGAFRQVAVVPHAGVDGLRRE